MAEQKHFGCRILYSFNILPQYVLERSNGRTLSISGLVRILFYLRRYVALLMISSKVLGLAGKASSPSLPR